ncbi:DUF2756 family protein [Vagococcus sp. WN89Y]|uniref:DUF2756 family protein n=1 Tax=Vagococcus sp. WN89Y TaxID=3457258 RepID=UPI003FCE9ED2
MKGVFMLAALLPFAVIAQPFNTTDQEYVNPSQQRLQTQMQVQQQQQKGMLNQQLQTQTRLQQQHLESQINNNTQRVKQGQPGMLSPGQQVLPNTSGGMLSGGVNSGSASQHMLQQNPNSGVQQTSPQATIPLKTLTP